MNKHFPNYKKKKPSTVNVLENKCKIWKNKFVLFKISNINRVNVVVKLIGNDNKSMRFMFNII